MSTPNSNSEPNVKPKSVFGRLVRSKHIEAEEPEAAASLAWNDALSCLSRIGAERDSC
ncbi:hypothetical protein KSP24_24385 [Paenibacillus sp. AK121]|uniref:hypothetical protein n=1 Tax=Paenibacillus sp. AK121 TaxID=2849670 RepID=UPI001C221DF8|nr:hypothetical protein [Paenibacillus sp. AK121]MBU9710032.1 hypothetical protein [Paenibacillus sp. AK121]MEE4570777.1 hypothetical protein [Paenibacillus polymyxa]